MSQTLLSFLLSKNKKTKKKILFLASILLISILFAGFFGNIVEGMKNCCGRCGGGGCNTDMHWGWPGKIPPAHQWYGSNKREKSRNLLSSLLG
tara:strand:+ start:1026 stop:1304 length:279 start_codon:yes stop_codon:yes gene_type:complete